MRTAKAPHFSAGISSHFFTLIKLAISPHLATSGERSLWTARELMDYARINKLKKLHYLGGLGHMTEIAYFLQNPDYSFEKLEEYRQAKS